MMNPYRTVMKLSPTQERLLLRIKAHCLDHGLKHFDSFSLKGMRNDTFQALVNKGALSFRVANDSKRHYYLMNP